MIAFKSYNCLKGLFEPFHIAHPRANRSPTERIGKTPRATRLRDVIGSSQRMLRKRCSLGPFESVQSQSFYDDYTERNGGRPFRFYS
jgi:hypothetical protein